MAFKVTYTVARAEFEAARVACANKGIVLVGDSLEPPASPVDYHDAKFFFNYVEPNLEVNVVHTPPMVSDNFIRGKLNEEFTGHK